MQPELGQCLAVATATCKLQHLELSAHQHGQLGLTEQADSDMVPFQLPNHLEPMHPPL